MKKVISIVTLFVVAFAFNVSAQGTKATPAGTTSKIELENVMISSVKVSDGANTVPVPGNRGTVKFTRRGGVISDVIFTDAAGKATRLQKNGGAANGAPNPTCKCPLPDACFGTADKNIGMCMCKPCDLSNGGEETYLIGLLLPAVQKVREAAARMKP